ncbi:MAG: hypothetical protein ACI4RN_06275, partial [Oscillospiraceae bacterium]
LSIPFHYLFVFLLSETENTVWTEFNDIKPKLLGSIFNTLKKGLLMLDEFSHIENSPRMADFVQYGAAFTQAMGLDPARFIAEFSEGNSQIVRECDSSDDLFELLRRFLEKNNKNWRGAPRELLYALQEFAKTSGCTIDPSLSDSSLSRKLHAEHNALQYLGIGFERHKSQKREIVLSFRRINFMASIQTIGSGVTKKYKLVWEFNISDGSRKHRSKTFPVGTNKSVVLALKRKVEEENSLGALNMITDKTMNDLIDVYLADYGSFISPTTLQGYKAMLFHLKQCKIYLDIVIAIHLYRFIQVYIVMIRTGLTVLFSKIIQIMMKKKQDNAFNLI